MAYSTTNPPRLMVPSVGNGPQMWAYSSADDDATVNSINYFSNGVELGMTVGDSVYVFDSTSPKGSQHYVTGINPITGTATVAFAAIA